jgi:hypothetical protein
VAGFVHEDFAVEQLRQIQAIIERHVGHEVDVAATCGLGRREDPAQAFDAMDKSLALVGSPVAQTR